MADFNTPLSPLNRSVRQKLNREKREIKRLGLRHLQNIPYKQKIYTFFSAHHGTFSKFDHILSNKTNINKYKIIGITQCTLSDHHGLKLEVNINTNSRKPTNTWKLNNAHLNHQWVKEEIKEEINDFLKVNENDYTAYANLWETMKALLKESL